jgi:malic enzyme
MEDFKATYARPVEEVATYACRDPAHITLEETIRNFEPTILIGTSGAPGLFTEAVVQAMAAVNERPIIFPLSNPTSKSECTAAEAIRWSDGRAIVATGSPFDPVVHRGRTHRVGQGNNAFVFPGVGLGLWVGRVRRVTDAMFLDAAQALARMVSPADLDRGAVYPELTRIRDCSHAVACAVIRRAVAEGYAAPGILPGLEETVSRAMWAPKYRPIRYQPGE